MIKGPLLRDISDIHYWKVFTVFLVLLLCFSSEAVARSRAKSKPNLYSAIIVDAETGRILYENQASAKRYPASLTKMMTLYLTFQAIESGAIRLDAPLPVSQNAAEQPPTKLGLNRGEKLRVYDAIMGLVTESANDAAVVLAEALGGSTTHFSNMMVKQARALGMKSTIFKNPNGLPDPSQVTSARDMAILSYALIHHFPGFYPYFERQNFVYKGKTFRNHNKLLKKYNGMDGIKTGYIQASGFNLAASAERNDTRLIGIVFGGKTAASRDKQMVTLLDNAFASMRRRSSSRQSGSYLPLPSKIATAFPPRSRPASPAHSKLAEATDTSLTESPTVFGQETGAKKSESWGVQVGAFSEVATARQALVSIARAMGPVLEEAELSLQKLTMTDGSAVYRARFMGLDRSAARSACAYIVKHGQGCLVVSGP